MAQNTATEATYDEPSIEEVSADTYEAERRFRGSVIIESDIARSVLVRRTWSLDDSGTIHESTNYYSANEPSESAFLCDTMTEWEPSHAGDLEAELMENLTMDAQAELDSVLHNVDDRTANRKLGVGNQ